MDLRLEHRTIRLLAPSLLLILLGAACSQSQNSSGSNSNVFPAANLSAAQKLANSAVVHCLDPSQCSPSVGMLVAASDTSASQCSAFLVAPNIAATNSHCIPEDLKTAGSDCSSRIWVLFPDMPNYDSQRAGCAHVLKASSIDLTFSNADYAFIQLDSSISRPLLQLSRDGLTENDIYNLIKIDPYQGNGFPEGYMTESNCKAIYGSIINKTSTAGNPVVTLGDCPIIHGNSGSPLIDRNGNVPAIVFATLDKIATELAVADSSLTLFDDVADLGLATNYACQALPSAVTAPAISSKKCSAAPSSTSAELQAKLAADMNSRIASSGLDTSLRWTPDLVSGDVISKGVSNLSSGASSYSVIPAPKCILDQSAFLQPSDKTIFGYKTKNDRKLDVPVWILRMGLNSYLQLDYQISEDPLSADISETFEFNPEDLEKTDKSTATVSVTNAQKVNTSVASGSLAACPDSPQN